MTRPLSALLLLFGGVAALPALDPTPITVTGGKADAAAVVVRMAPPAGAPAGANVVVLADGTAAPVQTSAGPDGKPQFVFVVPAVKAGAAVTGKVETRKYFAPQPGFRFVAEKDKHSDLVYGQGTAVRPVVRYMNAPRDGTSKDTHELTFKPFHHVFDPAEGKTLLTNGAGLAADKANTFPHHRGLFFAWNKVSYPGPDGKAQTCDVWHGKANEYVSHDKVLSEEAGEVFGRQKSALTWHGTDGKPFAAEERELTVYAVPGGTLIDFNSTLTTDKPSVKLDGDPQHAGFHFRAAMEVAAKTKGETYYVRPDGKGKPGETRNWDAKAKDAKTVNLPWDACSFVVGGKRWTVLRVGHPDNPGEARGSERDYGRFGDYFEYDLTPAKPLTVKYRVWVQAGEMTVDQCAAVAAGFVTPLTAK